MNTRSPETDCPSPESSGHDASTKGASESAAEGNPPESKPLTPEEQMALYEEDLKETDWGHQPC